jgi:magnesium chelatase subunit D
MMSTFNPSFLTLDIDAFDHPAVALTASAVLTPALRSILVLDASPTHLTLIASILQAISMTVGEFAEQQLVPVFAHDDDLWGIHTLHGEQDMPVGFRAGLLGSLDNPIQPRILILSDLAAASLEIRRTLTMVLSSSSVTLERHGLHAQWTPSLYWVIGCPRERIGEISPNLLDRISLRIDGTTLIQQPDRMKTLPLQLLHQSVEPKIALSALFTQRLQEASSRWAQFDASMLREIATLKTNSDISLRRQLVIAQLAVALARLENSDDVKSLDIARSMTFLGYASDSYLQDTRSHIGMSQSDISSQSTASVTTSQQAVDVSDPTDEILPQEEEFEPIWGSVHEEFFPPAVLPQDLYPEDTASPGYESASLRYPIRQSHQVAREKGIVIGVTPTRTFHDLALLHTILAAAPFQSIRRHYKPNDKRAVLISATDLRRYRRQPHVEHLLLLVLDYTSLHGYEWQSDLIPHMQWAYTTRAAVGIIQIGAAKPEGKGELIAVKLMAQNILVPKIHHALSAQPGRATPLAHGLELARQILRTVFQHGRLTMSAARLVIVTDGRGNVPLQSSLMRQWPSRVNRQGIEDALEVAQQLQHLRNVDSWLLYPPTMRLLDLSQQLGAALGATIVPLSSKLSGESNGET